MTEKCNLKILTNPFVEFNFQAMLSYGLRAENNESRIHVWFAKDRTPHIPFASSRCEIHIPEKKAIRARIEHQWEEASSVYLDCIIEKHL